MSSSNISDITSELEHVHGGNRGRAIWNGVRTAYKAVRPVLKETADVVKDLGIIGGAAYGAKKVWDSVRGNPQQPAQQPQQPQP